MWIHRPWYGFHHPPKQGESFTTIPPSMSGNTLSNSLLSLCFNLLTGLLRIRLEYHQIKKRSSLDCTFWSRKDFVVAFSTYSNFVLNSMSTSYEDLSCLISFSISVYNLSSRGCLILSCLCSF